MLSLLKRRQSVRSGTAAVEFAVVAPVFVFILLGTIETCSMIFLQQSLEIAAYEATRVTLTREATTVEATNAARALLDSRRVVGYTITVTPNNFQSAAYGTFIRVDVSAPCNSNSLFPLMIYGARTLTGTVEMMKEYD